MGRGSVAAVRANRLITRRTRFCTVKARVVRQNGQGAPLARHLGYLQREGVTRDGENACMFGAETDDADVKGFGERCKDDRRHFRFIVSPEDAVEMADLKTFTRELMAQAERDLGTKLDWIGVDHWNTDNPHVHVILRGCADDGQDLVIDRDYSRALLPRAYLYRPRHTVWRSLEHVPQTARCPKRSPMSWPTSSPLASAFGDTVTQPAWKKKPSWYQISSEDHMIAPDNQNMMSARLGARKVITLKASHASLASAPAEAGALIDEAATAVS